MELPIITGNCVRLNDNGRPGHLINLEGNLDIALFEPHEQHVIAHVIDGSWVVTQEGIVFRNKLIRFDKQILTRPPVPLERPVHEVMCESPSFIVKLDNGKVVNLHRDTDSIDISYSQIFWFDCIDSGEESMFLAVKYGGGKPDLELLKGEDLSVYPVSIKNLSYMSILTADQGYIVPVCPSGRGKLVYGNNVIKFEVDDHLKHMCLLLWDPTYTFRFVVLADSANLFIMAVETPIKGTGYTLYLSIPFQVAMMKGKYIVSKAGEVYRVDRSKLTPQNPQNPLVFIRDGIWPGYQYGKRAQWVFSYSF